MRKWAIGCGLVFGIVLVLCVGAIAWLATPPKFDIPPRNSPPNNAHPEYRAMALEMRDRLGTDMRFNQIEKALRDGQPVPAADRAYYLQRMEPYLRRYRQLLSRPCVITTERSAIAEYPELAMVRHLARAEAYLMREELRQRRYSAAIQRAQRLNRLAEQVRNGGPLIHYMVGVSIHAIALRPLHEELPRMQDRASLEALLKLARNYEKNRIPLWRAMQEEYYFALSIHQEIAQGRVSMEQLSGSGAERSPSGRGTFLERIFVKTALPEFNRYMTEAVEDLKKPFHQRNRDHKDVEKKIRHPLNATLLPVYTQASEKEAYEVAMMRLVGCTAAIRLHKLRTGKYPQSLEVLNLGEMIIDPYSGKPFVYKTDPRFGFLLYSVSENRVDDGGQTVYGGAADSRGDLSPVSVRVPESLKNIPREQRPLIAPIWLR
ncbi:MAG: hypothetical protein ACUVR1_04405 [Fimbriimonadales bacterium]